MKLKNIFDSHAHYNDDRYNDDRDKVINQVHENGVSKIINVGYDLKSSQLSICLAEKYNFIYASVGIHPHDASKVSHNYIAKLENLAKNKKVIAIGEIGLDYYYENSEKNQQKKVFCEQMELAKNLNLPVIIHSRDATQDTLEILEKYKIKGVVHCFAGSKETAKIIADMGMYLGFTGVITFPKSKKAISAIKETPIEKILLETDCPYMAPVPFRGKRCQSDMIDKIAEKISEIKNIPTQQVIDICYKNTCELFQV